MMAASTPAPDMVQLEVEPVAQRDLLEHVEALLAAQHLKAQPLQTAALLAASEAPLFHVDVHTAFVPLTAEGMAESGSANNLEHAAKALDSHDDLLSAIEAALGISLEARSLAPIGADDDTGIALLISDDDRHLGLFLSTDHPRAGSWARAASLLPPDLERLLVPVELRAVAARLSVEQLSTLENGDAILLPSSMDAELGTQIADMAETVAGRFAIEPGIFMRSFASENDPGGPDIVGFGAALKLSIALGKMPAIVLANSEAQAAIALPALGPGMAVTLSVGGRPLASGEIVELAGQLAVLVGDSIAVNREDGVDDSFDDHPTAEGE